MLTKKIVHTDRGLAEVTEDEYGNSLYQPLSWKSLDEYLTWMIDHLDAVFPGIGAKDRETVLAFLSEAQTRISRTQG